MTTRKSDKTHGDKKLKLKKETLRDLKAQRKDKDIKGGRAAQKMATASCLSCEEFGCR